MLEPDLLIIARSCKRDIAATSVLAGVAAFCVLKGVSLEGGAAPFRGGSPFTCIIVFKGAEKGGWGGS
jgi:hypothetical protein